VGWVERGDTHLVESRGAVVAARISGSSPPERFLSNWQMGIALRDPSHDSVSTTGSILTNMLEQRRRLAAECDLPPGNLK
jgi:hypothetical protein